MFAKFLYRMLDIYPEKRSKAADMFADPWIWHTSINKNHICNDKDEIEASQEVYSSEKATIPFFRELKNYSEVYFDADVSESMDDESDDEDAGWRTIFSNFFRKGTM